MIYWNNLLPRKESYFELDDIEWDEEKALCTYINLNEHPERSKEMHEQLTKLNIPHFRSVGVDPEEAVLRYPDTSLASHKLAKKIAHTNVLTDHFEKDKWMLVLEDDVEVKSKKLTCFLRNRLRENLVYFGTSRIKMMLGLFLFRFTKVDNNIWSISYPLLGTHAYAIRGTAVSIWFFDIQKYFYDTPLEKHKNSVCPVALVNTVSSWSDILKAAFCLEDYSVVVQNKSRFGYIPSPSH